MVCTGCEKQFDDGFSFCPHCGKAAGEAPPKAVGPEPVVTFPAGQEPEGALSPPNPEKARDGASKVGSIVFGAFAAISLLVAIGKGFVPLYLIESVAWAWAAWYWHTKKVRSRLAEALVIILGVVVTIGEGVHLAGWLDSRPQGQPANPIDLDSTIGQKQPTPSFDPVAHGATPVPPGFMVTPACPEALPAETVPKPLTSADASRVMGSGATIDYEGEASLTYQNMTQDQCITGIVVELDIKEEDRILKEQQEIDDLMLGPGKATTFSVNTRVGRNRSGLSIAEWHTLSVFGFHAPPNPYAEFGGVPINSTH